jgi:hypothetical protein
MALKPKRTQIKLVNKKINHANKMIFPDPVIQSLGEKGRLIATDTVDETCHAKPQKFA